MCSRQGKAEEKTRPPPLTLWLHSALCNMRAARRLCCKVTQLADVPLGVHQEPQGLYFKAAFQPNTPPACTGGCLGFPPPQGQDVAFPFALLQEIPAGQDLQPVNMPLNGSTTIWRINQSSYFCHTCKSTEGVPCPINQVINEDGKQHWSQCQPPEI